MDQAHGHSAQGQGQPRQQAGAYVAPPVKHRRAYVELARAHTAHLLTLIPEDIRDRTFGCDHCGELNPGDWCNNCEANNIPWCAQFPNLIAPYCGPCHAADLACRNCKVKPSNGPSDLSFDPPGWQPGSDQVHTQIAGAILRPAP